MGKGVVFKFRHQRSVIWETYLSMFEINLCHRLTIVFHLEMQCLFRSYSHI